MAITKGTKRKFQPEEEDGDYLSDESTFYGDSATKHSLETLTNSLSPREWWAQKRPSLMEIAQSNLSMAVEPKEAAVLYNPYEGLFYGRQLSESVDEFLSRLPPATAQLSEEIPWIFIANPYRKTPIANEIKSEKGGKEMKEEGPPDEKSDWAQFVVRGGNLLQELTGIRHEVEKRMPGKAKGTITKALNPRKEEIVKKLLDTAVECHCTSGKWMLFCEPEEVNAVWSVIARGTANNELGIAARVAPDDGDDRKHRLICVYTEDFTDIKDVLRVVTKLKDYGLVESRGKGIYYKCDAYTHLHLSSGNEYNIKASLYSSTEVLQAGRDGKVDGFFYKKK